MPIVLIAVGGAAGAVARFLVDQWVTERVGSTFPWGTLIVNASGSFVLGVLFALAIEGDAMPSSVRLPVMVGFIGAYTTFSTFALETWRLVEAGSPVLGLLNLAGSCAVGLIAIVGGLSVGRAIA